MDVVRPCPPVGNDIVTPRPLLLPKRVQMDEFYFQMGGARFTL